MKNLVWIAVIVAIGFVGISNKPQTSAAPTKSAEPSIYTPPSKNIDLSEPYHKRFTDCLVWARQVEIDGKPGFTDGGLRWCSLTTAN